MVWFQRWFEKITAAIRSESKTTQNVVNKQIDSIREEREAAQRDQSEAAKIIARAINTASDSTSSYEQTQRDKEYGLQRWLAFLTFLAAGGALAAAFFSWRSLDSIKISADAAKRGSETAVCALKENQRQFQLTSKSNQEQFIKTLGEMKLQNETARRELGVQSRPVLWIIVKKTYPLKQPMPRKDPAINESARQREEMRPRQFVIKYAIENRGTGATILQASTFHWRMGDQDIAVHTTRPELVCEKEKIALDKDTAPRLIFPGDKEAEATRTEKSPMTYFSSRLGRADICVAYRGFTDDKVHITAVNVMFTWDTVSPAVRLNRAD